MTDPNTTLRIEAYPQLDAEAQRSAWDARPTHPQLALEEAYYRTLSAEIGVDDPGTIETTTQWPADEYEPTVVLPPEPEAEPALDFEVDVESAITSQEWEHRHRPVSVRPAPLAAPAAHRWPFYLAAAVCGGLFGFAFWLGLNALV